MTGPDDRARRPGPSVRTQVVEVRDGRALAHEDRLATEEPLEIRLSWPGSSAQRLAVTMRTPGHDFELAAGWLVHEQILSAVDLVSVRYCTDTDLADREQFNVVTVHAAGPPAYLPQARAISSACGVCGTSSITEALRRAPDQPSSSTVDPAVLAGLPDLLYAGQPGHARTGGLHAAGLFTREGVPVTIREDVGRHNALDKAVGAHVLAGRPVPPLLVLSGRVGFELVQKALVAGVSAIAAVGAPTSLAVSLAAESGLGLVGFTRADRFVVYAGRSRFGV